MRDIPTISNIVTQTIGPVEKLTGATGGLPPIDPDLYYQPGTTDKYLQPITGDLYKRTGSP